MKTSQSNVIVVDFRRKIVDNMEAFKKRLAERIQRRKK